MLEWKLTQKACGFGGILDEEVGLERQRKHSTHHNSRKTHLEA